jgi:hypothetical protein
LTALPPKFPRQGATSQQTLSIVRRKTDILPGAKGIFPLSSKVAIGFGVQRGIVDGAALCRMFARAIRGPCRPQSLSWDPDPLYRFHPWHANLRALEGTEIKTVP